MMPSIAASTCKAVASGDQAQLETIRSLRAELAVKQDRIEELEAQIGMRPVLPPTMPLTASQATIFGMILAAQGAVTGEAIEVAIYGAMPDCDKPRNPRGVIKAQVHHLRKMINLFGLRVDSTFIPGGEASYFMSGDMKAKARALIEAERAS